MTWTSCSEALLSSPLVLEVLDISDNFLSSPLDLTPLARLKVIRLGQKNLTRLTRQHFLSLPRSLSSLDISSSPQLVEMEAGSLERFTGLEVITISHNPQLSDLPSLLSSSSSRLEVDLTNNSLSTVRADCLPWSSVSRLSVSGNPLACNCDLAWLLPLLPLLQHQGASCHLPLSLRGTNISQLTELDHCQHLPAWTVPALLSSCSLAILLLCLAVFLCHRRRHKPGVTDISRPALVFPEQREDLHLYWDWGTQPPAPHHLQYPQPLYWPDQTYDQPLDNTQILLDRHKQDKIFYNGTYHSHAQKGSKSRNIWNTFSQSGAQSPVYTLTDSSLPYRQRDIIYLDLLRDCATH